MTRVFDTERRAQASTRPRVPCEADDAAGQVIVDAGAGFGPDYPYVIHRSGHGLGMDGH